MELEDRTGLLEVHQSVGFLQRLTVLNLRNCKRLAHFPRSVLLGIRSDSRRSGRPALNQLRIQASQSQDVRGLKSLIILNLSDCSKLDRLPQDLEEMKCMEEVDVGGTAIRELPFSIVHLTTLKKLSFREYTRQPPKTCRSLLGPLLQKRNPNSSCLQLPPLVSLCSLQELVLRGCNRSEGTIPDDLDSLALLEQLDLSRNNFVSLPKSISRLSKLRFLCLEKCRKLQSLPELPREIMVVGAENCSSLEVISSALEGNTSPNVTYCFLNCFKLVENQGRKNSLAVLLLKRQLQSCMLNHVSLLYVLQELSIHSAHFHICLPGSEISKWFTHWSEGPEVQIGQSPNWFSKEFMGFAVCAVISNPCNWYGSECYCKFYLGSETIGIKSDIRSSFESDHLWLGYLSLDIFKILVFLFCFSIWLTLFVIFLLQLMAYGFWCCYSVFIHGFFFNCNMFYIVDGFLFLVFNSRGVHCQFL
ncbi:hypothetical protein ACOSQ4_009216 [Xanthoceras sorbifolium]